MLYSVNDLSAKITFQQLPGGTEQIRKHFNQDSRFLGWCLEAEPPENKAGMLTTAPGVCLSAEHETPALRSSRQCNEMDERREVHTSDARDEHLQIGESSRKEETVYGNSALRTRSYRGQWQTRLRDQHVGASPAGNKAGVSHCSSSRQHTRAECKVCGVHYCPNALFAILLPHWPRCSLVGDTIFYLDHSFLLYIIVCVIWEPG
jgi:hypothetical protein